MNWRGRGGNNWFALCADDGCGVVAVCFEGCCGGMCWPVDRPANRSRRWSGSTRGFNFFVLGDSFTRSGVVMRRRATSGEMARGGLVFVFSLEVAPVSVGDSFTRSELGNDTGLMGALLPFVLRVVAGACVGRGSGSTRGFNFFVLGDCFTCSGVDGTRGLGVGGLIRCAGRPREWSCGAVPPQERWHEGGWFLFFLWRLLRCRRGILSHARSLGTTQV